MNNNSVNPVLYFENQHGYKKACENHVRISLRSSKKRLLVVYLFVSCLFFLQPIMASKIQSSELAYLFSASSKVWKLSPEKFLRIQKHNGFQWTSDQQKKTILSTDSQLRFVGIKVFEAKVYFAETQLSKMVLSVYNRGDVGWVKQEDFENFLTSVRTAISDWVGEGPYSNITKRRTSKIKLKRMTWKKGHTRVDLEWSATKKHEIKRTTIPFRSEFIRLRLRPSIDQEGRVAGKSNDSFSDAKNIFYAALKSKVQKNDRGDIYLRDVPMVDQGEKSYCATASVSRVLGYYGKEIDQHEIAQMVETSRLGTSPEIMLDTLKQLSHKLGIRVRVHQDFEFRDLRTRIEAYNRLAKRERKEELQLYRNTPLTYYYQKMDKDILFQLLTKTPALNRFFREVRQHIQIGIPLAWSVILGVVSEEHVRLQNIGGHMRLIIGYNPLTKEIIYTDSWGRGP